MFYHTNIYEIQDVLIVKYFYDNQDIRIIWNICINGHLIFGFNSQSISKFLNDRQWQK